MTKRFVPIKSIEMEPTVIVNGKPVGNPPYWMQQDFTMTLSQGSGLIEVRDPEPDIDGELPTYVWLASDLEAPTDADGYNLDEWPEHNGGPSWMSEGKYRPNVRRRRWQSTRRGEYIRWDKSVYFEHNQVNHMWLDLGSEIPQPYTVLIVGVIHSYPSATYGHYLLDAGKRQRQLDLRKDHTVKDKLSYRSAMLFQMHSALIGTHKKADLTFGKHVRVKHNYRRFPRMFFGVFNENHSRIGAIDKRYKFWKGGKTDNKSVRRLVMGRRTNKISDNLSAHMTVVEVHFYNRALSRKQLMKQYKLIAAKYNFNKIRVR